MEFMLQLVLLVFGLVFLVKGADWFVDGAAGLASRFGIPQLVIGLTIVAMGTSAPEAAVSITSALKGNADITIGNIIGSNILNVLLILGISAMIVPLAVAKSTVRVETPFMIAITGLLLWLGWDASIGVWNGIVLLFFFLAYLAYLFRMAHVSYVLKIPKEVCKETEAAVSPDAVGEKPWWFLALWTIVGLALVIIGSQLTVNAASTMARILGLSERFIGLTIVALGTSLPELFTSVSAARKGNADIAIGNIVGSNIFNILFVVGLSALIVPIPFAVAFRVDTLIALAAAAMLLLGCFRQQRLPRKAGVGMTIGYLVYFIWICC